MSDRATRFGQHGRWYAELRWATIPVDGKKPRPKGWETTKPDEPGAADGKWHTWGERHNMGVVCGPSRLAVVDVDHADAESVYLKLFGALPATPIVRTGRGERRQVYFRDPGGLTKTARDGLELRVGPHMCVLPPSEHPDTGRVYEWLDGHEPWTLDLVPVPQAVLDYFGTARQNGSAPVIEGPIPEGSRHDTLMRNACAMRRRGMGETEILAALRETNRRCAPPLDDDEVAALAADIADRYQPEPSPTLRPKEPEPSQPLPYVSSTEARGGLSSVSSTISTYSDWPSPLKETAFHGLAGRIVRTIEPHSEADPAGLLAQTLVVLGSLLGRGRYFTVEADNHYSNLYVNLIGETSKARKGSSYGHIERLAKAADPEWADRVESGLTSGEGLIWAVRDPSETAGDQDAGVPDKRLLVFEPEFANVLRVLERQGNRLSSVVRDAWDGRTLRTLTRTTAAKATGAHVAIVGHITGDELRRYLDRTEVANGFGNRFLWLCVRRSKFLPEGGSMHTVNVEPLIAEIRAAQAFARTVKRTERDADARAHWIDVYHDLSAGLPGLAGALTGRAEAQVMRLAHVYALLDCSEKIRLPHLEAALELWGYCLRSVQHIFGASLGDPTADTILDVLRRAHPGRVSRTDIRSSVGGRVGASQIERALALLQRFGLTHMRLENTGGRPAETWGYGVEESKETEERSA